MYLPTYRHSTRENYCDGDKNTLAQACAVPPTELVPISTLYCAVQKGFIDLYFTNNGGTNTTLSQIVLTNIFAPNSVITVNNTPSSNSKNWGTVVSSNLLQNSSPSNSPVKFSTSPLYFQPKAAVGASTLLSVSTTSSASVPISMTTLPNFSLIVSNIPQNFFPTTAAIWTKNFTTSNSYLYSNFNDTQVTTFDYDSTNNQIAVGFSNLAYATPDYSKMPSGTFLYSRITLLY